MTWRDQLRPGAFRGAKFQWIDDASQGGGRRGPDHEYPLRDTPYPEDLGMAKEVFTLNVVTIGATEDADRKALRAACNQPGLGLLVHPLWGEMMVMCRGCNYRVSTTELGVTRFVLTFTQGGAISNAATVSTSTTARVASSADTAQACTVNDLVSNFDADPSGGVVAQAAAADSTGILGTIEQAESAVRSDASAAFQFFGQVSEAIGSIASLVAQPLALASSIVGIVRTVSLLTAPPPGPTRKALVGTLTASDPASAAPLALLAAIDNPVSGVTNADPSDATIGTIGGALVTLSTVDPSYQLVAGAPAPVSLWTPAPQLTPSLQTQADNRAALLALTRRTALIGACRAASARDFASYNEAVVVRDDLSTRLDLEIFAATSDPIYRALRDLRISMERDITARAASLPQLVQFTPVATIPALLLAYKLYDDPSRETEIVARNDIAAPAFVAGGQPVLVLNE